MKFTSILCAGALCSTLLLSGCSSQVENGATSPSINKVSTTNKTNTTNTSTNTAVAPDNAVSGGASGSGTTTSVSHTQLIQQSMGLAHHGQVLNVGYSADTTNIGVIEQQWGKPTRRDSAGAGQYDTYDSHGAAFGFNKGGQVFDVRSYSAALEQVTMSDVKSVLGNPGEVRHNAGETIWLYTAGPKFQLLWVFAKPSGNNADPHVDHTSVFCPQDTVNSMAQNVTSPSILVDQPPGSVGSLFTFSIQPNPSGYALSELEWIGSNSQSVVTTYSEAVRNGASGGDAPHFEISGDGKTTSFDYSPSMVGQFGKVVVIFQNQNGQAVIGESGNITLK